MAQESQHRSATERPSYKLSVNLLATYKNINELFYEAKRKRQALEKGEKKAIFNDGYDDESGNYVVQIGEEIAGRYIVQDVLGKGSFGVVVKAHDHRRDECVAVKIIKNKIQFFHQAKVEMEILTKLNATATDEHNIVKLKKVFNWKEHLCLVFELLSFNLYDLLKYTKFNGVSLNLIRKFACQVLRTLEFLASQPAKIIHCDLKPENILLKNPKRSGIKVIDFGSSCFLHKKMFKYIQSRFYRSPEVIWGLNYDCAIDIWSLACILVEMHTGLPLFDGKDEAEQLLKFQNVLGPPPTALIEASPKRAKFYTFNPNNKSWVLNPHAKGQTAKPTSLEDIIGVHMGGPSGRRRGQAGHSEQDYTSFLDLIIKMLHYNPKQRITPTSALQHHFLSTPDEPVFPIPTSLPTDTNQQVNNQKVPHNSNSLDKSANIFPHQNYAQGPHGSIAVSGLSPGANQIQNVGPDRNEATHNEACLNSYVQPSVLPTTSPIVTLPQGLQYLNGTPTAQLQLNQLPHSQLPLSVQQAQQQYFASLLAQAQAHGFIPAQQQPPPPITNSYIQTSQNLTTSYGPNAGKENENRNSSVPVKLANNKDITFNLAEQVV